MQILGKTFLLLLIINLSYAGVKASFSHTEIYKGDRVDLIIESNEEDTQFPDLQSIGGFRVEGVSSSQNVSIINGKRSAVISKRYSFSPTKSFTFKPLKVKTGNGNFQTKPITLKVAEPKETKDALFSFKITSEKREVYVGESFLITLEFDYDERLDLTNLYYDTNNLENMLVKELNRNWKKTQSLRRIKYSNQILVTPTKDGQLQIGNQQIIAEFNQRDRFSMFGRGVQKRVISNPFTLKVNPMPQGSELIGKFGIKGEVDKTKINPKEAVTVTYTVFGEGNLENYELVFPKVEGVTLFEDKSNLQYRVEDKKILSKKTFKAAYVADKSFTIPPATLNYFDKELKTVVTKKSKSFPIEVIGSVQKSSNEVILADPKKSSSEPVVIEKSDPWENFYYLLAGVLLGAIFTMIFSIRREKKDAKSENNLYGKGNKKELYNQLLSFSDDKDVKMLLGKLEKEFYEGVDSGVKKSDLKKLINQKLSQIK